VIRPGARFEPSDEALDRLFAPLRDAPAILVAVSGGPDSVALLNLLARWSPTGPGPALIAATVDHGLRPDAAAEAAMVARQAATLGIPHRTLAWTGPKPRSRVQEAARTQRYALLVEQARREGATHLATAHTLDDQAETILMRLSRGSGLAGMRPEVDRAGIRHVRPLLAVAKAPLVELCRREGWTFVEDPSNPDERFARARWRKLLPALAAEGLTPERLAQFAARARRADEALDAKARAALAEARAGAAAAGIPAAFLRDEPFEIAVRALAHLLLEGRDGIDHLRLRRIEAAALRLRAALGESRPLRLTLAGRVIGLDRDGFLLSRPELPRRRGRYPCVSDDDAASAASLGKGGRRA
jgi:tRNA(Ile)-lysidine synthase